MEWLDENFKTKKKLQLIYIPTPNGDGIMFGRKGKKNYPYCFIARKLDSFGFESEYVTPNKKKRYEGFTIGIYEENQEVKVNIFGETKVVPKEKILESKDLPNTEVSLCIIINNDEALVIMASTEKDGTCYKTLTQYDAYEIEDLKNYIMIISHLFHGLQENLKEFWNEWERDNNFLRGANNEE